MFKQSFKKVFSYSFSNILFSAIALITNLFVLKILAPQEIGFWHILSTLATYASVLTLGVINGSGREIPFLMGKKSENYKALFASTYTWTLLVITVTTIVTVLINFVILKIDTTLLCMALFFTMATIFQILYLTIFRSFGDLKLLSFSNILMTVILLPVYFITQKFGLEGFVALKAFVLFAPIFLFVKKYNNFLKLSIKKDHIKELSKIGFPLLIAGLLFQLLNTTDRYILLGVFDQTSVGLYSLSIYALTALSFTPRIVSTIFYPKMAYSYGESNTGKTIIPYLNKSIWFNFLSTLIIGVGIIIFVEIFKDFIPLAYKEGIPAMRLNIIAGIFLNTGLSYGNYLNVVKKQMVYFKNILISFMANLILGIVLALQTDLYLSSVAYASVFAFLTFWILQYLSVKKYKGII